MNFKLSDLKTERQWRSSTGLTQAQFSKLSVHFEQSYAEMYGRTLAERTAACPNQPTLGHYEDLLFFTLFSLKSGLTYDLLGFVSGMNGSNAKRNQTLGLQILQQVLATLTLMPKREFSSVAALEAYFQNHKKLLLDATQQRTQRPGQPAAQKQNYSGKKKGTPSRL